MCETAGKRVEAGHSHVTSVRNVLVFDSQTAAVRWFVIVKLDLGSATVSWSAAVKPDLAATSVSCIATVKLDLVSTPSAGVPLFPEKPQHVGSMLPQ